MVLLVLWDMTAIFDLANHEILIKNLFYLDVPSSAIAFVRSYRTGHSYHLQFNCFMLKRIPFSSRIPPGFSLAPLLFNLYMSPPPFIFRRHSLWFY